jgi:hypothetical protein
LPIGYDHRRPLRRFDRLEDHGEDGAIRQTALGPDRARAKARGIHIGRPSKLTPHPLAKVRERPERGDRLMEIARAYGVSHTTVMRYCEPARSDHAFGRANRVNPSTVISPL